MECPFCDKNNIDDLKLLENEHSLILMNLFPIGPANLLAVPKAHKASLIELDEEEVIDLFLLTREAAATIEQRFHHEGMNIFFNKGKVAGQSLEHMHVHLVPRWSGDGLKNFERKSPMGERLSAKERTILRSVFQFPGR